MSSKRSKNKWDLDSIFRVYAVIDILDYLGFLFSLALVSKQVSMSRAYLFRGGYADSWGHNIVSPGNRAKTVYIWVSLLNIGSV